MTYFLHTLVSAAYTAIPHTYRPCGSKCVPWWSSDCSRALRLKRARWKSYKRKRLTPDKERFYILYKQASASFRRVIRLAKTSSWQTYVSTISSETPIQSVWSRIRKISGKYVPPPSPVLHIHGEAVADPQSVADALGDYFSTLSRGTHLSPEFLFLKAEAESHPPLFQLSSVGAHNAPFASHELFDALKACKHTCEGPDDVHYVMLQHLSPEALAFLLVLYNKIWTTG